MKIAFTTLGCKLNFAESSALGKALLERGHTRAKQGEEADICIINTCSVTDTADHKDRQAIHRIRRQNPNAILIVTGCYAQLKPGEIAQIEGVDFVLGQDEKFHLPEFIESLEFRVKGLEGSKISISPIREVEDFHGAYSKDDRTRCFLKVQDGCNYFCSYCTIPLARGKSRNPSIASVVKEAQEALKGGAKELILSGVNIGDFGRSTNERFIDLLKELDRIQSTDRYTDRIQSTDVRIQKSEVRSQDSDYRIRISSCEPNLLSDEIIDFVANSKHFAPHFHIPLQSGSNEVLKIMGRRYTRELFAERVAHIKRVMPHAFIGVDCMVGVRGETEECWRDYVDFIEQLPVSQLHVFTYSERANTRMLEMDLTVVPQKERERRSKELHAISARKTEAFYREHEGYEATVLWESTHKDGLMFGFTENYIKVSCPYDKTKANTFERLTI
ncbi:MAG: radical SAM protein [Paludibacteraceae bacterium]|nr:radical SAM protein [Paludibacteraceae bacterium]